VGDQPHSQRVVDAPVAQVQRIGQRGAGGRRGNAHVKQLALVGFQTNLDVAQRLAPGELREGHDTKQVGAAERAHSRIALVPFDDASKGLPRYKLHHLRKQRLAHVHAALPVVESRKHRKRATRNSNRGHPKIAAIIWR
jgi:hypothetical protein